MAVPENDGYIQVTATGGESEIDFDFLILERTDLTVRWQPSGGAEETLVLDLQYSIPGSSLEMPDGGVIVLDSATYFPTGAGAGDVFTLILNPPAERATDFTPGGGIPKESLNTELDRVWLYFIKLTRLVDEYSDAAQSEADDAAASATDAANSATSAASSATDAANSATSAANSATSAATSETNAASSEGLAEKWATEAEDVEVEPGEYSAYHWAKKSEENAAGSGIGDTVTGGTEGSVLFVGAGSERAQDNTNLFWDDANNRLGIGTSSPSQALNIASGNIGLSKTTHASEYGIIYKGTRPFIHDFNYGDNGTVTTNGGNLFLGDRSGNLTMGETATSSVQASYNVGIGAYTITKTTTGYRNIGTGKYSLNNNKTGYENIGFGYNSGATGVDGSANETGTRSIFIGTSTKPHSDGETNQTVIGAQAHGLGSNSVVIGNDNIVTTALKGNVGSGTTLPTARNHVRGTGTSSSAYSLIVEDSTGASLFVVRNDGAWSLKGGTTGLSQTGYVADNVTTDRTFNADSVSIDVLADVLGTLINDLKAKGVLGGT